MAGRHDRQKTVGRPSGSAGRPGSGRPGGSGPGKSGGNGTGGLGTGRPGGSGPGGTGPGPDTGLGGAGIGPGGIGPGLGGIGPGGPGVGGGAGGPGVGGGAGTGLGGAGGGNGGAGGNETLISRRRLLFGAAGVGAVAAIGVGALAYNAAVNDGSDEISYLDAPASALTTLNDFAALDSAEGLVQLEGEFDIPYGSLVWANDGKVAACLLPTETGSPLAQVGLLYLGSGMLDTVLERAVGAVDHFEIYDVRANAGGMIWTEANILQGTWRIYTAPLDAGTLGTPKLAAEGDDTFDTPAIAVAGRRAFWLENPKNPAESGLAARLMATPFGSENAACIYESSRRMGTPPYTTGDSVTIAPRVDSPSVYYELTNIDADSGAVRDTLTLPHAIAPIECGYGRTGFLFSFPDIYDYDGAIANLGTYTPRTRPSDGDYNAARWFAFTRTPTAAPAWCDDLLIVKSTYAICAVDLDAGTYGAIEVENGADTYGEYLASSGTGDTFVTFTNIDHTPIGQASIHTCRVKVWSALASAQRAAAQAETAVEA